MNKAILTGRLGRDPELKQTNGGLPVCNLALATEERVKVGDGWEKKTEWHRVVVFGRQAEVCAEHLRKGSTVVIDGSIRTRSYEKDGVKHYQTEINANHVEFGASTEREGQTYPAPQARLPAAQQRASQGSKADLYDEFADVAF